MSRKSRSEAPAARRRAAAAHDTLQTTPAAEQGEVERAIRATMTRAGGDLNRIDYRALNADARTQYDTAKRFIQQAEDAIRMKNLPFAKNLADKAAVLAAQLCGTVGIAATHGWHRRFSVRPSVPKLVRKIRRISTDSR